jgi:chromosome partitioning protein
MESLPDVSRETSSENAAGEDASGALNVSRETNASTPPEPATDVSRETSVPESWSLPPEFANSPLAAEAAQVVQMKNSRSDVWPTPSSGQRIIAIANQKGGVGKTTSTVNLGAALAMHGLRVLIVDLDPQGNACTALGVSHPVGTPSMYDVLLGETSLHDVTVPVEAVDGVFCAPSTIDLAGAEVELTNRSDREFQLRHALGRPWGAGESADPVSDGVAGPAEQDVAKSGAPFDYILIDCPPSLGQLTVNALVAAQELLLPIQCEFYALEGLAQLLGTIDLVRAHLNPGLEVSSVLLTMYDARTRLADQVAAEVRSHFGDLVLAGSIPRGVRVSEAPGFGQTVMTYDPGSRGAVAYLKAARQLALNGVKNVQKPVNGREFHGLVATEERS